MNYLVICAMAEEEAAVKNILKDYFVGSEEFGKNIKIASNKFTKNNKTIYLTQSGIGSVNAAINLSIMLDHLAIDGVLLLGVGGALTHELNIGDLVISQAIIQHDYKFHMDFGSFCITPGEYAFDPDGLNKLEPKILADKKLIELVKKVSGNFKIYNGLIASGSEFSGTKESKKAIHNSTGALLVEMEAAAISQVCKRAKIPFVVAKTVSDRLNAEGNIETDFQKFLESASHNAALIANLILN